MVVLEKGGVQKREGTLFTTFTVHVPVSWTLSLGANKALISKYSTKEYGMSIANG